MMLNPPRKPRAEHDCEVSIVSHGFGYRGSTFGEAVEALLLGKRIRPMFRPGEATQWYYGEEIAADHPTAFHWDG